MSMSNFWAWASSKFWEWKLVRWCWSGLSHDTWLQIDISHHWTLLRDSDRAVFNGDSESKSKMSESISFPSLETPLAMIFQPLRHHKKFLWYLCRFHWPIPPNPQTSLSKDIAIMALHLKLIEKGSRVSQSLCLQSDVTSIVSQNPLNERKSLPETPCLRLNSASSRDIKTRKKRHQRLTI